MISSPYNSRANSSSGSSLPFNYYKQSTTPTSGNLGDMWFDTSNDEYYFCSSTSPLTWSLWGGGSSGVSSISGTTNEISASASTGVVTLSTPSTFIAPGTIQDTSGMKYSLTTGITAAGSGQGTATPLTTSYNVVSTVASGTGVVLPTASAGLIVVVVNEGANPLIVYPASGATIDVGPANNSAPINVGGTAVYQASSGTQWYTIKREIEGGTGIIVNHQNGYESIALGTSGVAAGTYTTPVITVDSQGRVTSATNANNFTLTIELQAGDNGTYFYTLSANFPFTINSATYQTTAGTITGEVFIAGTGVTGLTSLSFTTTKTTTNATANNTVVSGNSVYCTFSSNSSATYPVITLSCTRTG